MWKGATTGEILAQSYVLNTYDNWYGAQTKKRRLD